MNLDIIEDGIVFISVNYKSDDTNYSMLKGYSDINWTLDDMAPISSVMNIVIPSLVKINKESICSILFQTKLFQSGCIEFLKGNEIIESYEFDNSSNIVKYEIKNDIIINSIRVQINTPSDVKLTTITIDGEYEVDDYKSYARSIKIDNLGQKLLPETFINSDIEYIYNEWYNNIIG